MLFALITVLMKVFIDAQVSERFLHVLQGLFVQRMMHTDHELVFQPAAGMEVGVKPVDLFHRFIGAVNQPHKLHVGWQNVVIVLQLMLDEVQRTLPETPARRIQQYNRHQRAFAGLYQCQHFQGFIQSSEAAWA